MTALAADVVGKLDEAATNPERVPPRHAPFNLGFMYNSALRVEPLVYPLAPPEEWQH